MEDENITEEQKAAVVAELDGMIDCLEQLKTEEEVQMNVESLGDMAMSFLKIGMTFAKSCSDLPTILQFVGIAYENTPTIPVEKVEDAPTVN